MVVVGGVGVDVVVGVVFCVGVDVLFMVVVMMSGSR